MNCCNDYSQCNQNSKCSICASIKPDWKFCPKQDKAPHTEMIGNVFYFIGFVLSIATLFAIAGVIWGLLDRIYL